MKAWAGSLRAAVSGVRREGTSDMGSDAPDECLWGVGRGLLAWSITLCCVPCPHWAHLRQQVSPSSKDQMASYTTLKTPCSSWPQKIQVTRPMELSRRQTCCFYLHLGLANCLNSLYHLSILPSMYFQLHVRAWKIGSFWEPIILFASVSKNMSSLSCAALKTAVRSSCWEEWSIPEPGCINKQES